MRWRGVALDEFTGRVWKKSATARQLDVITERAGLFQFGTTESINRLTTQTFFLEPLDSPVLFAAPRVVAVQGDLPFVRVDEEGSVQSRRHDFERLMYKALSDTNEPRLDLLRNDLRPLAGVSLSLPATAGESGPADQYARTANRSQLKREQSLRRRESDRIVSSE